MLGGPGRVDAFYQCRLQPRDWAAGALVAADAGAGLAAGGGRWPSSFDASCGGDLTGMFDGPTSAGIRLDGPLVVLDLAALTPPGPRPADDLHDARAILSDLGSAIPRVTQVAGARPQGGPVGWPLGTPAPPVTRLLCGG